MQIFGQTEFWQIGALIFCLGGEGFGCRVHGLAYRKRTWNLKKSLGRPIGPIGSFRELRLLRFHSSALMLHGWGFVAKSVFFFFFCAGV